MSGSSNITGDESILFSDNMSFDGTERGGKMTTNGQLWIGSTASRHVKLGSINAADTSVTVGYSSPNITLSAIVKTITVDLTAADILDSNNTAFTIIPAQGPNTVIQIVNLIVSSTYLGTAYVLTNFNEAGFGFVPLFSGGMAIISLIANSIFLATADSIDMSPPTNIFDDVNNIQNLPFAFSVQADDIQDGTTTFRVTANYIVTSI